MVECFSGGSSGTTGDLVKRVNSVISALSAPRERERNAAGTAAAGSCLQKKPFRAKVNSKDDPDTCKCRILGPYFVLRISGQQAMMCLRTANSGQLFCKSQDSQCSWTYANCMVM